MVQDARIRDLNDEPIARGKFVLYWMQASVRTRFNYALEFAIGRANALQQPLVVAFGLMDDYPEANERHYAFLLEGLRDVHHALRERQIKLVVRHGHPQLVATKLAENASIVICDRGYTRHQKAWRDHLADQARRRVIEVESDVVVPVETVSDKQEYAARTIRQKLHRQWPAFLIPLPQQAVRLSSLDLPIASDIDVTSPRPALKKLKLDRSVGPVHRFEGGENAGREKLHAFIRDLLSGYAKGRNEPSLEQSSQLSPYLTFGQISPVEMVLAASEQQPPAEDVASFVEELAVRRELSMNYVNFCPNYDSFQGLPTWAQRTLKSHQSDKRMHTYSLLELTNAATHDRYWNAAMLEMTKTGFMHNYMRMYWGKKVIEWTADPVEAHARLLSLNNKYFIDGRGPTAFANVGWVFGLHDRPWGPERPIFGLIRYMNDKGLERKFDMEAYIRKVEAMP